MDPITHLSGALIKGGVTDGSRSVFYSDVLSVEFHQSSSFKNNAIIVSSWILMLGGILMVTEGGYFNVLIGLAVVAFFGGCIYVISGQYNSTVIVTTAKGRTKLVYAGFRNQERNLGKEISEILNLRKGSGGGKLPTDLLHTVFTFEGEKCRFFCIDGDTLQIFRSGEGNEISCSIDLKQVTGVEKKLRKFKQPKEGKLFCHDSGGVAEYDLIFVEHSGQEALHFIMHFFGESLTEDPVEGLVCAVRAYLSQKQLRPTS